MGGYHSSSVLNTIHHTKNLFEYAMTMQNVSQVPLPNGTKLAEYTIVCPIAAGGFSVVYLAQGRAGEFFAIKEYLPRSLALRGEDGQITVQSPLDRDAFNLGLKCFFEEGRVLSGIRHPNVVRVTNFFRANQTVYMVMEYADGRSLAGQLERKGGRLEERSIRKLFAPIVAGLREVHSNRLLHLDIKPANIYLRHKQPPLLIDFGAARQTLQGGGDGLASMYTHGYAAPEQYGSQYGELGPWTDIYALGATLYSAMGGGAPQPAKQRLQKDMLPSATKRFARWYSQDLRLLVDECLSLDPNARPASLMALQKRLMTIPKDIPDRNMSGANRLVGWIKSLTNKSS